MATEGKVMIVEDMEWNTEDGFWEFVESICGSHILSPCRHMLEV